jgi:hypothetical protein
METMRFDLKRKYWLATAILLNLGLVGWPLGVAAAIGLTVAQLLHFAWRERSLRTLTLQVRALYLALLLLGLWPPLAALHLLLAIGVWANVLFDYCAAARMLSLMPWNRRVPLGMRLVERTFLTPPGPGSILERTQPPRRPRTAGAPAVRASANRAAATRPSSHP